MFKANFSQQKKESRNQINKKQKGGKTMTNLELTEALYSEQTIIKLSTKDIEKAHKSVEKDYSNDVSRQRAFINRLTLNAVKNWLETESGLEESPQVWINEKDLPSIWEVINGVKISLGDLKIVLIPTEEMGTEVFSVPAEWVDIPDWNADYYLAVQVQLSENENWLRIYGYTSYKELKQLGRYDEIWRIYSLDREYLTEDLDFNVMWVAQQLRANHKIEPKSLSNLSLPERDNLLAELGKPSLYSPRFKVDFQQWAKFIKDERWRQKLYEQRLKPLQKVAEKRKTDYGTVILMDWFKGIITEAWQSMNEILTEEQLAYRTAYRSIAYNTIIKGKKIDLGIQLEKKSLALIVEITPVDHGEAKVCLQLHPREQTYLPQNLQLIVSDSERKPVSDLEAKSREKDNWLQLEFTAESEEQFITTIKLDDCYVDQKFTI